MAGTSLLLSDRNIQSQGHNYSTYHSSATTSMGNYVNTAKEFCI